MKPSEANRMSPTLFSFSASRSTSALMRCLEIIQIEENVGLKDLRTVVPTVAQIISSFFTDTDASNEAAPAWIPEVISGVVMDLCHESIEASGVFAASVSKSTTSVFVPHAVSQSLKCKETFDVPPPTSIPIRRLGIVESLAPFQVGSLSFGQV